MTEPNGEHHERKSNAELAMQQLEALELKMSQMEEQIQRIKNAVQNPELHEAHAFSIYQAAADMKYNIEGYVKTLSHMANSHEKRNESEIS